MVETRAPLLDHTLYHSPDQYRREVQHLFRPGWLYLGLAGDLGRGEAGRVETAGLDIAIGRTEGGLVARHQGRPIELGQCGGLVFGRIEPGGPDLATWLAPFAGTLAGMARHLGHADRTTVRVAPCGWKLLAENTLDDCHADTVHRQSLQRTIHRDWLGHQHFHYAGAHSLMENELDQKDLAFWHRLQTRLPLARFGTGEGYRHLFLFPNFYIASFFDAMVVVHRINPTGPETAEIEIATCLPLRAGAAAGALYRAVIADLAAKAEKVVVEDLAVCALAQKARHFAVHPGLLGSRELRVADFQAALVQALAVG